MPVKKALAARGKPPTPPVELSLKNSMPLTANATAAPMRFVGDCKGGLDLTAWLGKTVQLDVSLEGGADRFDAPHHRRHVAAISPRRAQHLISGHPYALDAIGHGGEQPRACRPSHPDIRCRARY